MNTWTIKKRIITGFTLVLLLVGALTATSYVLLRQAQEAAHFLTVDALPGTAAMCQIDNTVADIQINVLRDLVAKTPEEHKKFHDAIMDQRELVLKQMGDYEKTITTSEDQELFGKLKEARDQYIVVRNQLLDLIDAGKMDEALPFSVASVRPTYEKYRQSVAAELALNLNNGNRENENTVKATDRALSSILSISTLVLLLVILIGTIIARGLNKAMRQLATGLNDSSTQVSGAAGQVSASSQSLAEGASEQASSLEETSSSLEEMASMTKRNAENAQKANDLARQARQAADKGATDMQTMNAAMEAIKVSSDDIAKIIRTIDEIAFQTNILALNAAVEAARAGEAGMGFAVVADEVRNLAQRSAQAAKETAAKIEGAISRTSQGVEISSTVTKTLNEIVTKVRQVDELAAEVAGASREQTAGIAQINAAVGQMDKVTQSNAASAEESAAAAQELNAQAVLMKQSVSELLQLVEGKPAAGAPTPVRHYHQPAVERPIQRSIPALPGPVASTGIVSWNEEKMATGVPSVDSQHQELIRRINDLHADCVAGKAREELMEHLNFLGAYAQSHFADEEKIMQEHRCASRGQNKAAHVKFLQDYEHVVAMVKENGASTRAAIELKRMLGDWLTNHICRIDVGLRNCPGACRAEGGTASANGRKEIPLEGDFKNF